MVFIINLKRFDNGEKDYFIPVLKSAIKELTPIELLVMIYLYRYRSYFADLILISINHLVTGCGYAPNNRKSRQGHAEGISIKFANTLKRFIEDEIINVEAGVEIDSIKPSELFHVQLNMEKVNFFANMSFENKSEEERKEYPFVLLEFPIMDKIIKSGVNDVAGLMCFYLYIKQYISIDEGMKYKHYAFVTNDNLKENVIVSNDKLYDSFVLTLQDLQLMYKHNFGYRNVDGILAQVPNAYVLDTKHFKAACKDLKQTYKICKLIPYEIDKKETDDVISDPVLSENDSTISMETEQDKSFSGKVAIEKEKSSIKDMNPFHDESNPTDNEETLPFDASNMNPKIVPYKPFGGVFEHKKKEKSIRDMNDSEFFEHMGWLENQDEEDQSDNDVDITSIVTDSDDLDWEDEDIEKLLFG